MSTKVSYNSIINSINPPLAEFMLYVHGPVPPGMRVDREELALVDLARLDNRQFLNDVTNI